MRGANINASGGTAQSAVKNPLNIVLTGQKIVAEVMDDGFIENCAKACAKKLNVTPIKVSTGLEFINALVDATQSKDLSACVFWGHSWNVGLYLQNNQGLYLNEVYDEVNNINPLPLGAKKLSHLKNNSVKITPNSLFIIASCGSAGAGIYQPGSFAVLFADFINKMNQNWVKEGTTSCKITVIGADNKTNLKMDGTSKCPDGNFHRIESHYIIRKKAIYKTIKPEFWEFWKEETQEFVDFQVSSTLILRSTSILGKTINPAEIIKEHNKNGTTI